MINVIIIKKLYKLWRTGTWPIDL
ncbi:uncharacterized protein METZ01_LOCUS407781, partial [marine metagenome]